MGKREYITKKIQSSQYPKSYRYYQRSNSMFNVTDKNVQALRLCTGRTAHSGSRGIALLFHDQWHWKGGEGSASRPGRSLPPGKTRYPLYRRLGGPQGRSGQMRKISPPPGFDPRTVQPVASRYTDWATGPTCQIRQSTNYFTRSPMLIKHKSQERLQIRK